MRKVASYCFEAEIMVQEGPDRGERLVKAVDDWLHGKGQIHQGESSTSLEISPGQYADLSRESVSVQGGSLKEFILNEPSESGRFRTTLTAAFLEGQLAFAATLEVGGTGGSLSPVRFDARCPRVVRDIARLDYDWRYGNMPIFASKLEFTGSAGGDEFIEMAWSADRALPIVVVSNDHGLLLHPGISDMIAYDLVGLATVIEVDSGAAWQVTHTKGKEWSCYGGAIRIYWPNLKSNQNPFQHQLWTAQRLLSGVADTEAAAERIRRQLRKKVLGLSSFTVFEPKLVSEIRKRARKEELQRWRQQASSSEGLEELESLNEELFERLLIQSDEIEEKEAEIQDLKVQLGNLQDSFREWQAVEGDEVQAEKVAPPVTVAEAVERAQEEYADLLVFGADVEKGVQSLAADAGPPEKILDYLAHLARLAETVGQGTIGNTLIGWLKERGVSASVESETVRNNEGEMRKRNWDDGEGVKQTFESHLKPNEATSPDRCVRIYFDLDYENKRAVVGWVGRHP